MPVTYHLRIKKEYATAVIEDLRKNDAVELLTEEDAFDVPQWQKDIVRKRVAEIKKDPSILIDEVVVFNMLKSK